MKKNVIYSVLIVVILIIASIFIVNQEKMFSKNYFYMDTLINVKIYAKKKELGNIFEEIDEIYSNYHKLTDRFQKYDNLVNVYYINNNDSDAETLKIDERLYDIIEYSLEWKEKTNGLFNVEMGDVISRWKEFLAGNTNLPTKDELETIYQNTKQVKLLGDNHILNNKSNLDLGGIAKGYATTVVGEYLHEKGFDKFVINAGGHVLVGNKYQSSNYKIGVKNPTNPNEILTIVYGENISVATSGSYERFYEYEGEIYSHIINPKTLYPANYMKSVTVISNDSKLNDVLTTSLFLMPIDEGKKFLDNFEGVEAIWVSNDNEIIRSKGFSNYEQK